MSRATDDWQESMRYALDTGTMPARPRGRRWLKRLLVLSCLGITSALALGKYPGAGPTDPPDAGSTAQPSQTAALANPESTRKRSFTRKSGAEPSSPTAAPQATAEPGPQQVTRTEPSPSRPATAAVAEPAKPAEPATTGAVAEPPRKPDDATRATSGRRLASRKLRPSRLVQRNPQPQASEEVRPSRVVQRSPEPQASDEARPSRVVQRSAEVLQPKKSRRAARRHIVVVPAIEHTSLHAPLPVRPHRSPQPVVARPPAERMVAMAPRRSKTTVCLYFVLCF
jgi:hypothetical protein